MLKKKSGIAGEGSTAQHSAIELSPDHGLKFLSVLCSRSRAESLARGAQHSAIELSQELYLNLYLVSMLGK